MSDDVPISEQIECVQREIKMRARVYPNWISSGRIAQREANTEMRRMRAVLATLQQIQRAQAAHAGGD